MPQSINPIAAPYIDPSISKVSFNHRTNLVIVTAKDGSQRAYHPCSIRQFVVFDSDSRKGNSVVVPGGYEEFASTFNQVSGIKPKFVTYNPSAYSYTSHSKSVPTRLFDFTMYPISGGYCDPRLQSVGVTKTDGSVDPESIATVTRAIMKQLGTLQKKEDNRKNYGYRRTAQPNNSGANSGANTPISSLKFKKKGKQVSFRATPYPIPQSLEANPSGAATPLLNFDNSPDTIISTDLDLFLADMVTTATETANVIASGSSSDPLATVTVDTDMTTNV